MKRLIFLLLFLLIVAPPISAQNTVWPGETWLTSTPEEQGISSSLLADTLAELRNNDLGLHSLLVIRNGYKVLDVAVYPFDNNQPHVQFSATKSVISILTGIAIEHGDLKGLDQPVFALFDDHEFANESNAKAAITVEHLLTIRSGLNTTLWLNNYDNWLQYILDAPAQEPGNDFHYTDANAHLLTAALETATGMSLYEYADANLFQPLGITSARWELAPEGIQSGDGLYLSPYDMARIGYLYLNEGRWNGQQIVSTDWVAMSTRADVNPDYGYMWWIFDGYYLAAGYRGQLIFVVPDLDLVIVTTAEFDVFPIVGPIEESLLPNIQTDASLPNDQQAADRLAVEIDSLTTPQTEMVVRVPDTQAQVDGQRVVFEPNDLNWEAMTLTFADDEAQLALETTSQDYLFAIGRDGVSRVNHITSEGRFLPDAPVAMNGEWNTETAFTVHARYLDGRDYWRYTMIFGDHVRIVAREIILGDVVPASFVFLGDIEQ